MHHIKHEAHREIYGHLSPSAINGNASRTNSPRRYTASPHPKEHSKHEAAPAERLELTSVTHGEDAISRRQSPHTTTPEVHPQLDIDVPPDIAITHSSRGAAIRVILVRILFFSWINVLLVMVPVALAVRFASKNEIAIFITSTFAIIPLAALLGYSTEELAKRFGQTSGALFNITFGNATELIVFIIGIVQGQINVVQAAIIGSVLGNLLLILGMSFFLGGLRYSEQHYNNVVTQTTGCLLLLAITSLSIPTAFHASFTSSEDADEKVLYLSYATSIVLLLVYGIYLIFQLKTHAHLYKSAPIQEDAEAGMFFGRSATSNTLDQVEREDEGTPSQHSVEVSDETPEIPLAASIILLLVSTALVAVMAEFMVSSISAVVENTSVSEQFVGLIIVPIVGNAAEHISAVSVAYKNKMDLSISIALGSSLQIVLLVAPLAVLLGWALDQPLSLYFSLFETMSVFATVLIVTYLVIDGRSNYLEGALLMAAYVLIAIASIFYPSPADEAG